MKYPLLSLCFACCLAGFSATAEPRYTSLLRVGEHVRLHPEAESNLWAMIDARPGVYDELMFFTQNNHSIRSLARHREQAPQIGRLLRKAESRGLRAGINIFPVIGFQEDEYDPDTAYLPPAGRRKEGRPYVGRICATAPETLAYVREVAAIYADQHPAFIYADDDLSAEPCRCARCCRAALGAENAVELRRRLEPDDIAARRTARDRWLSFAEDAVDGLCAAVAKGVHSVDPKIGLGFMTYSLGSIGHRPDRWAATLADGGALDAVRWRPGGGNWTDCSYHELVKKTLGIAMQINGLPREVELIQGEIENFPFHALRKSPSYTAYEALLQLAVGCTGIAWDIDGFNALDSAEIAPYYDAVHRLRPAAERVVAAFGRAPSEGIAFPWSAHSAMHLERPNDEHNPSVPLPCALAEIGLPVASDPRRAKVTLLDRGMALELSDGELRRILSSAAYLDAQALDVVNRRGFGDLTGFVTDGTAARDAISRDLDHPLTCPGRFIRDVRRCHSGRGSFTAIRAASPGAQGVAEAVSLSGVSYGKLTDGVFENAAGGRVAVSAMSPFDWCESRARTIYLKRLFAWLSRESVPAYLASFHRAMVICRANGVFVANLATEPLKGTEVAVLGGGRRRVCVFSSGVVASEAELEPVRAEGAYSIYALPEIAVCGEALILPRRAAYVPEPQPVKSDIEITALYYPGTEQMSEWDVIAQTCPERKPILGWFDEGNPEAIDWQIKWAVEHGITSFCVDWYWNKGYQRLTHWLKGYYKAKYRGYLKWYMMYANHNQPGSHSTADQIAVTKYWIDHYFRTPEYYTIDGKPVVCYWQADNLDRDFIAEAAAKGEKLQKGDGVRRAFAISEKLVKEAGLPGIYWIDMHHGDHWDQAYADRRVGMGFKEMMGYNFDLFANRIAPEAVKPGDPPKHYSFDVVTAAIGKFWQDMCSHPELPFWPVLPTGWDDRPRSFQDSRVVYGRTPEKFAAICREARKFCDRTGRKHVLILPINEWQEGSYIEPNEEYGFTMYDAIRDAFCEKPAAGWPKNIRPQDVGLGPYDFPPLFRSRVQHWDFTDSVEGWYRQPYGGGELEAKEGCLHFWANFPRRNYNIRQCVEPFPAADYSKFRVRMRITPNPKNLPVKDKLYDLRLKWGTAENPIIGPGLKIDNTRSMVSIPVHIDGEWHEYELMLSGNPDWKGMVDELWFEACELMHARVAIDWMRFEKTP